MSKLDNPEELTAIQLTFKTYLAFRDGEITEDDLIKRLVFMLSDGRATTEDDYITARQIIDEWKERNEIEEM